MPEHSHAEKRCQDFLQDLSLYLDHEASVALCEEIERHLTECADCEVVVDSLQRTISLYRALPQPEMPEHLRQRLYHTFHLEGFLPEAKPEADKKD
ncbi:MAG: zf-HC2 domain-containing protein [Chloroflexota bacterium]